MPLNTIGNITYINQASSATSVLHANNLPHQAPLNHALFQEQMQKVEEVRPTEETHKIEDREGNGKREFREKEEQEETESDGQNFKDEIAKRLAHKKKKDARVITEDEMLMRPETHLLNIKG